MDVEEVNASPTESWIRHRLPWTSRTTRTARARLRDALSAAGIAGQVGADAELVIDELVSNAVRHGTPDPDGMIEVCWQIREDRVLLGVRDSGSVGDLRAGDLATVGLTGRGLAIVELICHRWYWTATRGTFVGAELLVG